MREGEQEGVQEGGAALTQEESRQRQAKNEAAVGGWGEHYLTVYLPEHNSTSISCLRSLCRPLGWAPDSGLRIKAQHPLASKVSSGLAMSPTMSSSWDLSLNDRSFIWELRFTEHKSRTPDGLLL